MIRRTAGGIQWLEFEIFAERPEVIHGVFLHHGGVSANPLGTLHVGGRADENPGIVEENRRRMLHALKIERFASCIQVHGDTVIPVEDDSQSSREGDALITKKTDLALMIKHADCQAAIFHDPVHRALANVHAGWRGNVRNIYRRTVEKMAAEFGTRPQDLLVGVSPSLGPKHAEFKNFREEFPEAFWEFQCAPDHFDLWAIARMQLQQCGILPHHIEIAGICTFENAQDFPSYRRDKAGCRNTATFAMLKSQRFVKEGD